MVMLLISMRYAVKDVKELADMEKNSKLWKSTSINITSVLYFI